MLVVQGRGGYHSGDKRPSSGGGGYGGMPPDKRHKDDNKSNALDFIKKEYDEPKDVSARRF